MFSMRMARIVPRRMLVAGAVVCLQIGVTHAQTPPLTLEVALRMARQNNRLLQEARLQIAEARGDLTGARMRLLDNPEVAGAAGPRLQGDPFGGRTRDLEIGVEQRFETGGQRRYRVERALAGVEASTASASEAQRVVELTVASTFYETLAAERRLGLLEENERLARELYGVAERRLDAGEGVLIEAHTARIRLAEVERRGLAARGTFEVSTVRLAALLGLAPDTRLQLQGDLPGDEEAPGIGVLVTHALESRPDLAAVEDQGDAAEASVGLADAAWRPDVAVGVFYAREEGDDIVTAALRLPIPIFNRNQGERERTRATRDRLTAQEAAVRLRIESEVRQALLAHEQARRALQLYDADVLRAYEESSDLLQRAFEAGEVSVQDVIVVQRELLEGREGFLDARLGLAAARAELLGAANLPQSGPLDGGAP